MRLRSALFGLVCATGFAGALALTVHDARDVAPLEPRVVSTVRADGLVTVVAEVRNTTDQARCVQLMIAARDREGRDLAVARAGAAGQLASHARRRESVRLTLSARQYAERLQRIDAYAVPC